MQQTSNYGLNKPEQTDTVNIDDLNANFDTLDTELKKVSDKANLIQTAGGTGTVITLTNVNLVNGFTITFVVAVNNNGAATTINGKSLYKPGGTAAPTLTAGKAVTVWYNGTNFFIKASAEGDAVAADVLANKKFSNDNDTGITGTMVNNGPASSETVNLTSQNQEYTIATGYHSGLRKIKAVISNLAASVIKAGTTVGGIVGTFTADATATAAQMLSGVSAYVNGNKVTGTMANKGGYTDAASAACSNGTVYVRIPKGAYLTDGGAGYPEIMVYESNLVPENILSGKNIIGVAGSIPIQSGFPSLPWSNSNGDGGVDFTPSRGYWDGNQMAYIMDNNLIPANILSGKNIFGVWGSAIAGKRFASGTIRPSTTTTNFRVYNWGSYTITETPSYYFHIPSLGLSFTPSIIFIYYATYPVLYFKTGFNHEGWTWRGIVAPFYYYNHLTEPENYIQSPASSQLDATYYAWE